MQLEAVAASLPNYRFTRDQYDRMVESGALDGVRVELLAGVIVPMSPEYAPHAHAIRQLNRIFTLAVRGRAEVLVQNPIRAAGESEPEPDVALIPLGDWRRVHPDQTLLVVEVADSSLRHDRGPKRALYAASGFPEYWIVNLVKRQIEVWRDPSADGYTTSLIVGAEASVAPQAFPDIIVQVAELF